MVQINKRAVWAEAEAVIHAPVETVWRVHTDFPGWVRWNRAVRRLRVDGPLVTGSMFHWKAGGVSIHSTLCEVDRPKRIAWSGKAPGIYAVHVWRFQSVPKGTLAHSEESFEGLLPSFLPGMAYKMLTRTLDEGMAALKAECERRASAGDTP